MDNTTLSEDINLNSVLEKEIDLIQACIERMANHCFQLKGWLITLIAVLLAIGNENIIYTNIFLICVSIMFWYLNSVYLRYEKQYRELYAWVIKGRLEGNRDNLYNLDINRFNYIEFPLQLMFKNTLRTFYGTITLLLIVLLLVLIIMEVDIHILIIMIK